MKKTVQKLSLKKTNVSQLTSLLLTGGALPTTKQSTVNQPPEPPASLGCIPDSFSCYPDRCA